MKKKQEIAKILENETFFNDMLDMQTFQEVKCAFEKEGVEVSLEEIKMIDAIINKMVEKNSPELTPEELEQISGGYESVRDMYEVIKQLSLDHNIDKFHMSADKFNKIQK